MITELRPYQGDGVTRLRVEYGAGRQAVLYVLPTGGGKTVVFAFVAKNASEKGKRVVVLVHRDTLLLQASAALSACGVAHGIIAPGHTPTRNKVQVASVQTLVRRLDRHEFDLIIVDEAHHAVAGTWLKIIAAMPMAKVLGVSATPMRLDGTGLDSIFESMVVGPSIQDLINDGYLVRPLTYGPPNPLDLSKVATRGGDYDKRQLADAMDTPTITGDAVAHYNKLCAGRPSVVFCAGVKHAEDVAADFRSAGIKAATIHGKMPQDEIRESVASLGDGRLQVLTSCDLISEGFDSPNVVGALLLRPTKSEALHIQQIGRALRPVYAPGFDLTTKDGRLAAIAASSKPHAIILDHSGNCFRHGMPEDARDWTLEGVKRRRGKKNELPAVSVRQCPSCLACHKPAPACPLCLFVYTTNEREIEEVEGSLEQLDAAAVRRARELKERIRKARSLDDFHSIAKDYGYKPAWASIKFQIVNKYRGAQHG